MSRSTSGVCPRLMRSSVRWPDTVKTPDAPGMESQAELIARFYLTKRLHSERLTGRLSITGQLTSTTSIRPTTLATTVRVSTTSQSTGETSGMAIALCVSLEGQLAILKARKLGRLPYRRPYDEQCENVAHQRYAKCQPLTPENN